MTHFWLSFVDGNLPKGQQFLGACVVAGDGMLVAVMHSHALGINPGGEVAGLAIAAEIAARVPEAFRNRLLTRAECADLDVIMCADGRSKETT